MRYELFITKYHLTETTFAISLRELSSCPATELQPWWQSPRENPVTKATMAATTNHLKARFCSGLSVIEKVKFELNLTSILPLPM